MWLEQKYLGLLSPRFRNFRKVGTDTWCFSCPLCGDSEKHQRKARGYVYPKDGKLRFYCHNCGVPLSFRNLLSQVDTGLYDEYVMEKLSDRPGPRRSDDSAFKTKVSFPDNPLRGLTPVSELQAESPCRELVERRKIPEARWPKLYSCPSFFGFTNRLIPGKFSDQALSWDQERLLIPFVTGGKTHAYTGRALGQSRSKYVTIVLDDSLPKIFGMDGVDPSGNVLVFEGPLDSLFIDNAVAIAGGDLTTVGHTFPRCTLVFDNEPRNRDTVNRMLKAVARGFEVCVWPSHVMEKDVNDMVLAGKDPVGVLYTISLHAVKGLEAEAAISEWRLVR